MDCETCDKLLAAYKRSVSLFKDAEGSCQGLLGEEFQLAMKELQQLHQTCHDANAALTAHWRQDHSNLLENSGC
jgi:hypothetical protein